MATKKELTKNDVTYENGFPANIDQEEPIFVQITDRPMQSVVLYKSIHSHKHTRSYFGFEFADKYKTGIYEL